MNPVFHFDGIEANYINPDRLSRTVRLVPCQPMVSCSYGELLNGICDAGIQPDEISGIFKVSSTDSSYSILFKFTDTVDQFMRLSKIQAGKCSFDIMKMNEQVVNIRVHWLPIYFDNSILREIFADFGEVMDIQMLRTAHEKLVTFNGVREIRLKTDEFHRQQIPHLVNFNSGQSILITMQGRPPYCLKCRSVGHVRQRCTKTKSFSTVVRSDQPVSAAGPGPSVPAAREAPAAPPSGSSDTEGGAVSQPGDVLSRTGEASASGSGLSEPEQQGMEEETDGSLKRGREADEGGSWISPNKTAKSRPVPPDSLPLENNYSLIMDLEDVLK